jgi:3-oxoacid CoA-transferase subunit B
VPKNRLTREQLVQRAAMELEDGSCVNLGFGLPNLVSSHVPPGRTIYFHSENGIIGMGPRARKGEEDPDLVDAMKVHVTLKPGAAFFNQLDAHMMTRGGHLDLAMLGGLQVSEKGDLANWKVPGTGGVGGIGGAMDIAVGSPRIVVLMEHVTKEGQPKIVNKCSYPLTALECVHRIITDAAVIDVTPDGLVLREVAPGLTPAEIQEMTEPKLIVPADVAEIQVPSEKMAS